IKSFARRNRRDSTNPLGEWLINLSSVNHQNKLPATRGRKFRARAIGAKKKLMPLLHEAAPAANSIFQPPNLLITPINRGTWRQCDRCKRPERRLARHVERIGGIGIDCCLRCLRWLAGSPDPALTPAQQSARSNWRELFSSPGPRTAESGAGYCPIHTVFQPAAPPSPI